MSINDAVGRLSFNSSCQELNAGFEWAKDQALAYVADGAPVGKYYEAALPGRDAFCIRDVCHQSIGANLLGLQDYTKNMLYKFALGIAESRDYCTYWEIDKYDHPAPIDYKDETDFWYNLPANFDLINCCYKQYLWTGDRDYIDDSVFLNFYDRTVTDYIERWDKDKDGFPEHYPSYGRRGIASYMEDRRHPLLAGDLVAAQYAGFIAYSQIQMIKGKAELAEQYARKAKEIKAIYNRDWWNEKTGRFNGAIMQDRSFYTDYYYPATFLPLYFDLVEQGYKRNQAVLDVLLHRGQNVEEMSSLPEIFYKYGWNREAYAILLKLIHPKLKRREYPEVSYSVIGALITGTMGVSVNSSRQLVRTIPRLTDSLEWIEAKNIPVMGGEIVLAYTGNYESTMTNLSDRVIHWEAQYVGSFNKISANGVHVTLQNVAHNDNCAVSSVLVDVMPGESVTIKIAE